MYKGHKPILCFGKNTIFQIMLPLPEPLHQIWLLSAAIPRGLLWFLLQQHLQNFFKHLFSRKIFIIFVLKINNNKVYLPRGNMAVPLRFNQ